MSALDVLDAELQAPVSGALLVETRNSVYVLRHGRISGGIIPSEERYATARREGNHLVVRAADGRLIVETSTVQSVTRRP